MTVKDHEILTSAQKGPNGFVAGVLTLSGGAIIAQSMGAFTSPIISRLFSPDAVGVAALFVSIVSLVSLVGSLSYQFAIILPGSDKDAANIFVLCCMLVILITSLSALLIACYAERLFTLLKAPELIAFKWFVPLGIFFAGISAPLRYWNTRNRHFRRLAGARIKQAVVTTGSALVLGFSGFNTGGGLLFSRVIGLCVWPIVLGVAVLRHDVSFIVRSFSFKRMLQQARRYVKFPLITSWTEFLNHASRDIPTILFSFFFGLGPVGLYAFARRLVALPGELISTAVGQVFFQRSAAEKAAVDGNVRSLFEGVVTRLAAIGLLPMLLVVLIGPELFKVVLGQKWFDAGVYASILAVWLSFMFVCSPLTVLYNVFERQGLYLIFNILLSVCRVAGLLIGGLFFENILWALFLYCLVGICFNMTNLFIITLLAGGHFSVVIWAFLRSYIFVIPTAAAILFAQYILDVSEVILLLVSAVASIPYIYFVLRSDQQLRESAFRSFKKLFLSIR